MKPQKRTALSLVALLMLIGLFAAACGDSTTASSSSTTAGASSGTTTTAAGGTIPKDLSASLSGSGSTFQKAFDDEAITNFAKVYKNISITYGGGGSGKGKTDLQNQLVDFAGTDSLVKDADKPSYKGGDILYVPTVVAPITIAYNLSGVDNLKLSPDTIAKIFQRQIKTWDDPAILADNPDAKSLKGNIVVAHRSDSSGTTENFTKFLDKAAGASGSGVWTLKSGSTIEWPADTQGASGNAGVAQVIKDNAGAIGYVDYSDAKASSLKLATVKNKAGKFVAPTLDGASAAAEGATVNADLTYDPTWASGDAAYPITSPTWILVYAKQTDKAKGQALTAFLTYLLNEGQTLAKTVDYAPLPKNVADQAKAQVAKIQLPA